MCLPFVTAEDLGSVWGLGVPQTFEAVLRCRHLGLYAHDRLLQATVHLGLPTAGSILMTACCLWRKSIFIWKRSCRYARLMHQLRQELYRSAAE